MTEEMSKGSGSKGEQLVAPPTQPSPGGPGAGPALDLDGLERLEKAATPAPWGCGGGRYLPITATRCGLHCQIGRAESCGFHNLPSEEIEANGGLIAEGRNALPHLLAIARAAKEAANLGWGHCTESYHDMRMGAMDRLRAALDTRADAAPGLPGGGKTNDKI